MHQSIIQIERFVLCKQNQNELVTKNVRWNQVKAYRIAASGVSEVEAGGIACVYIDNVY